MSMFWPAMTPRTRGLYRQPSWSMTTASAGAAYVALAGRPLFTYTKTLATLPSFTTTCGSVMAPECFDLHADSALMSIAGLAGAAPANEIVPLMVELPCGPLA
jgi:hypothetical protein